MKPYEDDNCKCHEIEDKINKKYPDCDWNIDDACKAWTQEAENLKNNDIEFLEHSDEVYGCTCPTCGRMICGWCV